MYLVSAGGHPLTEHDCRVELRIAFIGACLVVAHHLDEEQIEIDVAADVIFGPG